MSCYVFPYYVVSYQTMGQDIYSDPIELKFGIILFTELYGVISYYTILYHTVPDLIVLYDVIYIYT